MMYSHPSMHPGIGDGFPGRCFSVSSFALRSFSMSLRCLSYLSVSFLPSTCFSLRSHRALIHVVATLVSMREAQHIMSSISAREKRSLSSVSQSFLWPAFLSSVDVRDPPSTSTISTTSSKCTRWTGPSQRISPVPSGSRCRGNCLSICTRRQSL